MTKENETSFKHYIVASLRCMIDIGFEQISNQMHNLSKIRTQHKINHSLIITREELILNKKRKEREKF